MKQLSGLLTAALLLLLQVGGAFAQSSDFETIESFKKQQQSLLESVKAVQDPGQLGVLDDEIVRLEGSSAQHRKLLDEGLYPQSLESAIAALRDQLKKSTERLALAEESKKDKAKIEEVTKKTELAEKKIEVITKQNEGYRASVDKLTHDVQDLSARIERLSVENTGLQGQIQALQLQGRKDKKSIAQLKELTEKLTANVRDRDELIVKLMDSLFDEYAKAGLTDMQKKSLLPVVQGNDYVSKIVATLDGNISYLATALLTPQDVRLLTTQQRNLSAKWEELKPSISKLYPDEPTRVRDITTVDGRLSDLKKSIAAATWRSVHQVFTGQNIAIDPFRNAGEFHARLLAYLDEQVKNPSREKYQLFRHKVWDSPVKDQWLPVIPTDELTEKQRADIEERIALWDKNVTALLWRWVLIGVAAAAVIAIAAAMLLRKKKPAPAA